MQEPFLTWPGSFTSCRTPLGGQQVSTPSSPLPTPHPTFRPNGIQALLSFNTPLFRVHMPSTWSVRSLLFHLGRSF